MDFLIIFAVMIPSRLTMVIPVKNRKKHVATVMQCVARALQSAFFNVIFVDNGSDDGTLEMLQHEITDGIFSHHPVTILEEPTPGAPAARNLGLSYVTTPYVMFFDSDDLFTPRHILRILDAIKRHGGCQLLTWDVCRADRLRVPPTPTEPSLRHHLLHASMATQRWCAQTELVRSAGGWNEQLPVWNDFELGVRLLTAKPTSVKIDGTPEVTIVPLADSITGVRLSDRGAERAMALDIIADDLRRADSAGLLPYVNARRMILAAHCAADDKSDIARSLRQIAVAESNSVGERILLRSVYFTERLFGRGGSPLAEHILHNG